MPLAYRNSATAGLMISLAVNFKQLEIACSSVKFLADESIKRYASSNTKKSRKSFRILSMPGSSSKYESNEYDPISYHRNRNLRPLDEREQFLSKQYEALLRSKAVLFMRGLKLTSPTQSSIRRNFKKNGIQFHFINKRIMSGVMIWSKYQPLIELLEGPTYVAWPSANFKSTEEKAYLLSTEDSSKNIYSGQIMGPDSISFAKEVFKIVKPYSPSLKIIGGKVDSRYLMNSNELEDFSKLPSRYSLYAEFLGALENKAQNLTQVMQHHSLSLNRLLEYHKSHNLDSLNK